MKMKTGTAFIFIILFLCSCSPTKKLNKDYFKSNKEVGLIINLAEFEVTKIDAFHLVDPLSFAINFSIQKAINSISDDQKTEVRQLVSENSQT